jgi:hypothetical protein
MRQMPKLIALLIALAALATQDRWSTATAQELRDAHDVLWLLERDRRNLGIEYQRLLNVLASRRVPNAATALNIAIRFKLAHGGLLAEEGAKVVGLLRLGRDLRSFASRGDLVWIVRISHSWLGVTQEMWIGSATGEVRAMLPVDQK